MHDAAYIFHTPVIEDLGPLLLTWFNFNQNMDK